MGNDIEEGRWTKIYTSQNTFIFCILLNEFLIACIKANEIINKTINPYNNGNHFWKPLFY